MLNTLLSGWSFYFRVPTIKVKVFKESGILLGGIYQAAVFYMFHLATQSFLASTESIFLSLILLSCLTGFFHEDGWADTFDAFGVSKFDKSEETIDKIDKARKDSRLGSFGASGIAFIWIFRIYAVFYLKLDALSLAFIILLSRTLSLYVSLFEAYFHKNRVRASSSEYLRRISRLHTLWLLPLIAGSIYIASPFVAIYYIAAAIIAFLALKGITSRMGYLSGDFVGATIIFTEIILGTLWGKDYLSFFA